MTYRVELKTPHDKQQELLACFREKSRQVLRIIIRAGRRSGKTTGVSILAVEEFLKGRRILYAAPTGEQTNAFWSEVTRSLTEPVKGAFRKNEAERFIERPGTPQRIKAKTAWNADTLRGDYADVLILDEFQLMNEDAWEVVGAPMLLDNGGDAIFLYTPPSLHSRSTTKATDPLHAPKLFKRAGTSPRWKTFHFTSHANPHINPDALGDITQDMTALAHRQEILAEDVEEAPGALWTRDMIERHRWNGRPMPDLSRIVVGVDPPGGRTECGIVAAGIAPCDCKGTEEIHGFVLDDASLRAGPDQWARQAASCFHRNKADRILGETNFGGDMVEATIKTADPSVTYGNVHASRGKAVRAEPVAALYEQGRVHHVGAFPMLEDEQCGWEPGHAKSPNRIDAVVWALTDLMVKRRASSMASVL